MKQLTTESASGIDDTDSAVRLLLFRVEQERYAIPLSGVREVVRYREYTPVPGAPSTLPGIISQRGLILAVINLRVLLGFGAAELGGLTRFVIVQHDDIDMALIVDEVFDLVDVSAEMIEPVPSGLDPRRAALLSGVVQHEAQPIALIDLNALARRLREDSEQ